MGTKKTLHPRQFKVNEAWIAFKINDAPICTEEEGNFDVIALMDAASCFIFGSEFVSEESEEISQSVAKSLLKLGRAQSQKKQLPKTLFIPTELPATGLSIEAIRQGITVERVLNKNLRVFIGEAREGFIRQFGRAQ